MRKLAALLPVLALTACGTAVGQGQSANCAPAQAATHEYVEEARLSSSKAVSSEAVRNWITDHIPGRPDLLGASNYTKLNALDPSELVDVCAFDTRGGLKGGSQGRPDRDTLILLVLPDNTVTPYMIGVRSKIPSLVP